MFNGGLRSSLNIKSVLNSVINLKKSLRLVNLINMCHKWTYNIEQQTSSHWIYGTIQLVCEFTRLAIGKGEHVDVGSIIILSI